MNDLILSELRAKWRAFPPYDWEDDVDMLLSEIDRFMKELHYCQHYSMVMQDALLKIQNLAERDPQNEFERVVQINTIRQWARGAQVRIAGEQ